MKLGERGAILVPQDGPPLIQRAIRAPVVVDTTGAGDTFTAAYAVALVEHQSPSESLRFAGSIFPSAFGNLHLQIGLMCTLEYGN